MGCFRFSKKQKCKCKCSPVIQTIPKQYVYVTSVTSSGQTVSESPDKYYKLQECVSSVTSSGQTVWDSPDKYYKPE